MACLILYFLGGPGAGSEFGLFTELGPLYFSDASLQTADFNKTGVPSLFRNDYAWTKVANVLMYDSPPPVGFSYCGTNVGGDGYSCGDWNDTRTAMAAHTFVENWMKAFPEFSKNDLYLSGESYAGVYIPMLAQEILNDHTSPTRNQLKGFAVGDGCVGTDVLCGDAFGPWWYEQFMYGHGQFSTLLHNQILQVCGVPQLQFGVTDPACEKLLNEMSDQIGGYYGYNLYDECGAENILSDTPRWRQAKRARYFSSVPAQASFGGALNDYPCGGVGAMTKWLNNSQVMDALHIPKGAYFFLTDNGVGFNYALTERNLMPFYEYCARNTSLRVLVYNGDTDPSINSLISQNWTVALGLTETETWRPWTLDGQQRMGGYVTRYAGNFDFLTIRGSGHMVPQYKPPAALEMITRW